MYDCTTEKRGGWRKCRGKKESPPEKTGERKGENMLDLVIAVTAFLLALTAVILAVYNVAERRGYRDGHEIGYWQGWREAVDETLDWFAKGCSEDEETKEA